MTSENVKPPEDCAGIEDVRQDIDVLDRKIVALLGRRAGYVEAAARFKTSESRVRAPQRQKSMLEARRRWAEDEGLSPDVIEKIYRTLIDHFVQHEMDRWRATD